MERGRRLVFCGIGVCVVLLLAFVLIIVLLPDKGDKKKKPDDAQTEEPSAEIPKQYLVSEISSRDKSKNEVEETVLFEYDELGRWSKVTRGYREWGEWEQLVYEFSYSYVNGEPYTVVVLTGRILCEERKDFEGHILYKKAYEYDEEGNLISEEDNDMLTTYKYVTVSLTEEQEKARAQFFLDEEMYRFDYFFKY